MKEILDDISRWEKAQQRIALARVVSLEGSGPRDSGAAMVVNEDGEVAGSVSGGCVEGAVVTEALEVLKTGERKMVSFGYSDDEAFAVGLTCGGTINLFIEPLVREPLASQPPASEPPQIYDLLEEALRKDRPVVLVTVVERNNPSDTQSNPAPGDKLLIFPPSSDPADAFPTIYGTLGNSDLDRIVARDALGELSVARTGIRHYGPCGEQRVEDITVFVESFAPSPLMVIFGAVDFTAALAKVAKVLGYKVIVCDAREVFATEQRFPMADEVIVAWPDKVFERFGSDLGPNDAVCILTHDPKFDIPAVLQSVETKVGYIGAMGSRRTHAKRCDLLREAGATEEHIKRVMAPIGLDIGSRTPEETAVSVLAEIIALRTNTPAVSLRDSEGPIHRG